MGNQKAFNHSLNQETQRGINTYMSEYCYTDPNHSWDCKSQKNCVILGHLLSIH